MPEGMVEGASARRTRRGRFPRVLKRDEGLRAALKRGPLGSGVRGKLPLQGVRGVPLGAPSLRGWSLRSHGTWDLQPEGSGQREGDAPARGGGAGGAGDRLRTGAGLGGTGRLEAPG